MQLVEQRLSLQIDYVMILEQLMVVSFGGGGVGVHMACKSTRTLQGLKIPELGKRGCRGLKHHLSGKALNFTPLIPTVPKWFQHEQTMSISQENTDSLSNGLYFMPLQVGI